MKNHKFNIRRKLAMLMSGIIACASAYAAVNSGDASLSDLELRVDGRNILSGFSSSTTTYNVELDDVSMLTMSAVPSASDATVAIDFNGAPMTNHSLASLDGGDNVITYTVRSGNSTKTYTVNIKTPQVVREEYFTWKNANIYFVLTDRFYNGDTSNDESYHRHKTAGGSNIATFHGGDIKGLTQKLDYLDNLGVNAIWISAPYEQMHGWTGGKNDAFPHYAFHGYYTLDWTYMDRNMGTIEDMRNFVTECHKRNIRVVMDIVLNHTGYATLDDCVDYDFGNFNGTPQAGWVPDGNYTMWGKGAVSFNADEPGKWGNWWSGWVRAFGDRSWSQGAGFTKEGGDNYTMSLAGLPDVVTEKSQTVNIPPFLKTKWNAENGGDYSDYRLPNLEGWRVDGKGAPADYIINWLAGWVEYFGIDGFRCDTAKHVELSRWNQLKQTCNAALTRWRSSDRADEYAKGWTDDFWMTGEHWGWDHGDTGYFTSGGFDSMINFAFNGTEGGSGRTPSVEDWKYYANFCNGSNPKQVLNYVSSHDTGLHRPGNQKNVATMLLLCPGGAQIYYGDETSRPKVNGGGDSGMETRGDFNWDAVDNDDNKHWQKIGQFRRRNAAVGAGTQTDLGSDTYGRKFSDGSYSNAVVIKLNTSAGQTYTVSVGDHFADGAKVMDGYNTDNTATVSGGKVTIAASGPVLLLEPYGTVQNGPNPRPVRPTVTANPPSGTTFTESLTVTLSSTQGAAIHYTTDGSTPSSSSATYSAPLTFTATTTLKTFVSNDNGSNVQTFTYTKTQGDVTKPVVAPNPAAGEFTGSVSVTLSVNPAGVPIHYSTSGAATASSPIYSSALTFTETTTLSTFVENNAGSNTQSFTYTKKGDTPVDEHYVYFDGTYSNPKVWAWTTSENCCKNSTWPGDDMIKKEGKWYWALPEGKPIPTQIIISNNGNDRIGGRDLQYVDKATYHQDGTYSTGDDPSDAPQKPTITITPNGGKVKGGATITVVINNEATSISGTFNGKSLSLSNGSNNISVSQYLTSDGATGTLSVTATNNLGTATGNASFTRDDSTPVYDNTLTGDWRELSIYQVMVGSFQHGNSGASGYSEMWGPEGHRKNGNLRGIIDALDYIKELGMNAIWMTPVFDSSNGGNGEERLKATGYFANDYFKIDPHFGTEAEFDELVTKAHEKGMYIILDGVFGHHSNCTGSSPEGNYIDNRTASNVRGNDAGNIAYPGSLDYFKEVIRYWMERGVDGWRLDQCYQVYQNGHNYWKELREECESVARERKARGEKWGTLGYMVGEDWTGAGGITVTQQDGLKSVMDFDGKDYLVNLSGVGSIGRFLSSDAATRGYRDSGVNPTIFLSNHDTSRVGDFVDVNSRPQELMTRHAATAAYSGPVCLYYGDEIGDKSGNGNADNKARTSGRISGFNQNEQKVHDYVSKVFKARASNPALWRGTVQRQEGNKYEVITKTDSQTGNKVVCIFSEVDTNVSIGGSGTDLINGGDVSGTVSVQAWVPAFIKLN